MDTVQTVRDAIGLWPTRMILAEDMTAQLSDAEQPVSAARVHKWAQNNAIPARFHRAFLAAAASRGFAIDADMIVRLHDAGGRIAA